MTATKPMRNAECGMQNDRQLFSFCILYSAFCIAVAPGSLPAQDAPQRGLVAHPRDHHHRGDHPAAHRPYGPLRRYEDERIAIPRALAIFTLFAISTRTSATTPATTSARARLWPTICTICAPRTAFR